MLYAIKELWEFDNPRDEAKKKENYQRDRKTYWIGVCITICIEYKICKIILSDFNIYRSH